MKHFLIKSSILFVALVFSIAFISYYILDTSNASKSSDVIDGNVSFNGTSNVLIFVHFHRTNNTGFLGYFSCKVGSQTYNLGGSATTTVYSISKTVSKTLFANNQTLACSGSEYQAGKPFVTAQRSFSPYSTVKTPGTSYLMSGGVVHNAINNDHVQIVFSRSDGKGFLGYLNCKWGNQLLQKGGSSTTTDYIIAADINASAYGNETLSCTGSEYQSGKPVIALQRNFSVSGGSVSYKMDATTSTTNTSDALTVNFHRTDNVGFLGYLSCYADAAYQTGGSITTKNYIVKIPQPYYTTTYTCKGSDYRGTISYTDITKTFAVPGRFIPTATPTPVKNAPVTPTSTPPSNITTYVLANASFSPPATNYYPGGTNTPTDKVINFTASVKKSDGTAFSGKLVCSGTKGEYTTTGTYQSAVTSETITDSFSPVDLVGDLNGQPNKATFPESMYCSLNDANGNVISALTPAFGKTNASILITYNYF